MGPRDLEERSGRLSQIMRVNIIQCFGRSFELVRGVGGARVMTFAHSCKYLVYLRSDGHI